MTLIRPYLLAGLALLAFGGVAIADDHLFQAQLPGHGLFENDHSQAIENSEEAPGQGSPFTGEHQTIPATDQEHAQHDQQAHQPEQAGPKK